ncbi:hypothetical protein BC937DRAFT_87396 [Endogone sp. FLAS-F59071]|nr:hypothetical protein BC937DRAFT_87396 [Endogone sp. FLAS-F59071]|eukprot:RUS19486.1 hypothetical protein BC937DRAFT_87396 [Endogone sp. FLAS-F59071]
MNPTRKQKRKGLKTEYHSHSSHHVRSSTPTPTPTTTVDIDINTKDFGIETFRRLNMGFAITREYKLANTPAFRINTDNVPQFCSVSSKYTEKIQCHSTRTKDFVDSHMSSAAAEACAHLVTSEAHFRTAGLRKQASFDSTKYQYETTILQLAEVLLRKDNLIVVDTFRDKIAQAVNIENKFDGKTELQKVFDEYGYFWPIKIALGGKVLELVDSSDSASVTDRKTGRDIGAAFKIRPDLFSGLGMGGSARHSREVDTRSSADLSTKETKHHRIGGNIHMKEENWEASLNHPHSWEIINRDNVMPIWRMLDDELASNVENIVNMSFEDRLSVNGVYYIRNIETNKFLGWRPYNYDKGHGQIIATSPVLSDESHDTTTWKFVRVPDQEEEPDNQYERLYLRYGVDRVYIQPNSHPNDYLHASQNYPSPVTKREGQVSLRQIDDPSKLRLSDVWIIERCNTIHEDGGWKNIDYALCTNRYVQKGDEFRLKCEESGYLASHDMSMQEVRVVIGSQKPKLKHIPNIFAVKFKEVIMLKENEVEDNTKMAVWRVVDL